MVKHLLSPGVSLGQGVQRDRKMLSEHISAWDFKEQIDAGIVGVPFYKGFQMLKGTSEAPSAIRETFLGFATRNFDFNDDIIDLKVRDIGDVQMHTTDVVRCHANMQEALQELYRQSPRFVPIVIGGDHSIAAPSIRAFKSGYGHKKVGLIDFDAHNDLGDPAVDGPSSGVPFRAVIDEGYIEGRNAVQVGLHSSMASSVQHEYAARKGLREVSAREVRKRGIEQVMEEAIAKAGDGTDAIYVSFDIDAIEAALAPGTGAHAPGGLDIREAYEAVYMLGKHPKVMALDIVEVDPIKDVVKGMTSRVACMLMVSFLVGLRQRRQLYA